jgi:hypothetical protein
MTSKRPAGMLDMLTRPLVSLVAAVAILSAVAVARGEFPHVIGRHCGIGWSDGYHSHTACPPKRHIVHHKAALAPAPKPAPWWAIPAEQPDTPQPEQLPTPAGETPDTTGTSAISGRSLFRQNGDGATVRELSALNGAAANR